MLMAKGMRDHMYRVFHVDLEQKFMKMETFTKVISKMGSLMDGVHCIMRNKDKFFTKANSYTEYLLVKDR